MRLLMTWLTPDSTNEVEMVWPARTALPVVGDGRGVGGEVAAELTGRPGPLFRFDAGVGVGEGGGEVVDGLQGAEDVAVPEEPLYPWQLCGEDGRPLGWAA
jgi:hypothetical protein